MLAALGPERAEHAYRLRSFIAAGVILPGSSDRPVVTGRPLLGIMDMVSRLTESEHPFGSAEAITVEEAMKAYTVGSAQAEHVDSSRGALKVGQLADFVVLDHDPRQLPPREIGHIPVVFTSCPPF